MRANGRFLSVLALVLWLVPAAYGRAVGADARAECAAAMRKAAAYFHGQVAVHGGYVYYYSLDLEQRWGEGRASRHQVWVQPPGTPTVGMAYLKAYDATGDRFYLQAATDAAEALVYGQLKSGGWTNCVDFDPRGNRVAAYRNGRGRGKDNSTLDDGITQAALRLLMRADSAHRFKHHGIRNAVQVGCKALLRAQFPNGAFPQVWTGITAVPPVVKASHPEYDWRTEGRVRNYWNMYTLNDGVAGTVADVLIEAHEIYKDEAFTDGLVRLGDFLVLAQMPEPQPGWAQQYSYDMHPIWARKFEPPAIAARESQDAMETLLKIHGRTRDVKYLDPIPRALGYLKRSRLLDGRLARYYELRTNRALYMKRQGKAYVLSHDDSDLPRHYGWKVRSRLDDIELDYLSLEQGGTASAENRSQAQLARSARQIAGDLDEQGRWVSTAAGERLVGQPKFRPGMRYMSSGVFSRNLEVLAEYLTATQ
ncbi:MAG: pectic acid lyase [Lentisphaerae bacterium]|nr:pectic acid lyase [Lentisphaerota bacterium]MBT5604693.1 pectic acid lyase [Lentisphaerota bacterium]MBT7841605.1 pectic acid lyase [Lentisphaerota bacterium]